MQKTARARPDFCCLPVLIMRNTAAFVKRKSNEGGGAYGLKYQSV
ncbi:hypothetical protein ES703_71279 [subsurface metagenome]